ncbi:MAG: ATP-binding protein [Granulosicoccus sp.]
MRGFKSTDKPSLLRVFLLSMAGIVLLFSITILVMGAATGGILAREEQLVAELFPEMDAVHQLTTATAGLQSQGFLLRSSQTSTELNERRDNLGRTVDEILRILESVPTAERSMFISLQQSVDNVARVAKDMVRVRSQQIGLQAQIRTDMQERLEGLAELDKKVQQQVVLLTEKLLETSDIIANSNASTGGGSLSAEQLNDQILDYEALSLSIQDHLMFSQDVVSLMAIVEKVPLLTDRKSVVLALQNRDLIVSALASRSIYMGNTNNNDTLLSHLRSLQAASKNKQSVFTLQEQVVAQEIEQDSMHKILRERTAVILEQSSKLRNDTRATVNDLGRETLSGLVQLRMLPLVLSFVTFLFLALVSYWLLYRKTVLPLMEIAQHLDDVGSERFPDHQPDYDLKEISTLASAMRQLDAAQRNMLLKDKQMVKINNELTRANEDLQQFAHIASHDLQEPLRKLQQFSALLVEDYAQSLDADANFFIQTIHNSATRMSLLIKETLAYSRAGSSNQKRERVDLSAVIQGLLDELDLTIKEVQAEFDIAQLPVVVANELGMAQLFRNFMVNSMKYCKPDIPARISISVDRDSGKAKELVYIRIEDNGIGIKAKYLEKILLPFERLHDGSIPGTGLGLAICKKVCDSHEWNLDVSSEPQKGTCFVIGIPTSSLRH